MVARANTIHGSFFDEVGQLLALREGLMLAKFYNCNIQMAEVTSPSVISYLYSQVPISGDAKFILLDIQGFVPEVGSCKCQSISKSGNVLALRLASVAFSSARECLWLDCSPSICSL